MTHEKKSEAVPVGGRVVSRSITTEMRESYLDYAMTVIPARALPDVRDGLKPVHRRILYAMLEAGLTANAKTRKSATFVGDVLGKYHPHGDASVYDGMATNIPPHNLREVCEATMHLIENPEATTDDLLQFVKGPDFPTGCIAFN